MFLRIGVSALRKSSPTRGFTLIEVLVAMTIFAAMIGLATLAFDQSLKQYHGLMEKGINFWSNARNLILYKSFNCATNYYVRGSTSWFPYFRGNQDGISYASLSPLIGDLPVVVWITKEGLGNGRYNVKYYELPLYTKTLNELERDFVFGDYKKGASMNLLEGVEGIEVSFYGYDSLKKTFTWTSDFDGEKRVALPVLIKLTYSREGKKDAMIFGIRTDSTAKKDYDEIYTQQ